MSSNTVSHEVTNDVKQHCRKHDHRHRHSLAPKLALEAEVESRREEEAEQGSGETTPTRMSPLLRPPAHCFAQLREPPQTGLCQHLEQASARRLRHCAAADAVDEVHDEHRHGHSDPVFIPRPGNRRCAVALLSLLLRPGKTTAEKTTARTAMFQYLYSAPGTGAVQQKP